MNIKESAITRLKQIRIQEGETDSKFRVFIQGGGCSGMQYGFTFDQSQNDDDFEFHYDDLTVLVDAMSMEYLRNASIDYREDLMGSSFVIDNPNAQTTCGCGSSFNPM